MQRVLFFSDDILGGKIRTILNETNCNTGILFSSQLQDIKNIHILFGREKDLELLQIAKRLAANYNSRLSIVDLNGSTNQPQIKQSLKKEKVKILTPVDWKQFDLILCDLDIWENHSEFRVDELPQGGGLLLIRSTDGFIIEA